MQFLLVALNAKYIHSNPAIYSLRSYTKKNENHVGIAEYTINNRTEDILEDIYKKTPDVVGFSCYIWNWEMIQEIVVELHKLLPMLPIWLGGPEVSYDAGEILKKYSMITGIMVGEGEETFHDLLQAYLAGQIDFTQIKGIVQRHGYTGERNSLSMSKVPFLYHDLSGFENKILYYESQRGCPYHCSYCLSSIDKSVRFRDFDIVKKELQFFLDHNVKQVKFVDRTFNCNHNHAMAIWQYIYEHDNGVTNFHFEIAGDIINEEELELLHMMRPGLVQLEIGVQTTNLRTLTEIRRVMDIDKLKRIVETIRQGRNIHQHLDLIAGLPFEDYKSFGHSFDEVYAMQPDQLQLGFLKVLKGSYMHDMAEEYGLIYLDKPPYEVLYTNWLTYEDVRKLKKVEEMVEIYYNSNQFVNTLKAMQSLFTSPFALFEALADFYQEKGYFIETPSRAYRYDVLLDFIGQYDGKREMLYRQLLTYDMYLREKLKSRPSFAQNLSPFRKQITEFYQNEENQKKYLYNYEGYDSKQLEHITHLEPLSKQLQSSLGAPEADFILFDYKDRNPLTNEAKIIFV